MDDKLVLVDLETFGLSATDDPIIEIGFSIYNLSTRDQAYWSSLVWLDEGYKKRYLKEQTEDSFVYNMHVKSSLWNDIFDAKGDITPYNVEAKAKEWLTENGITKDDPLVGSSVQFDREMLREQMPSLEKMFSYRNIDCSSLKELCRRLNPELYSKLPPSRKCHRVIADMDDTVEELEFYIDNFLFQEED